MGNSLRNFEHIVVLMFENRSFDHLFGAFPGANGLLDEDGKLKPDVYNLALPGEPVGKSNPKHWPFEIDPCIQLDHDCYHDFVGMMPELFGPGATGWAAGKPLCSSPTDPPANGGFYSTIAYNVSPTTGNGPQCQAYYRNDSLRVLHRLASEFVLCDNWFCDAPADTLINRFFMHSAQARGRLDDQYMAIDVPTIFDSIEAKGVTWKMYAPWEVIGGTTEQNSQIDSRFFPKIQDSPNTQRPITEFASDLAAGTLPFYSFLMCWLPPPWPSAARETSMHPVSDIRSGENYLASVYNALRNSPCWENTLLVVTFDENGGLYDHVPPPSVAAPNALTGQTCDRNRGLECTFDFTLLGPRVPALLISPWLRKGIAHGQYQNTSILRSINDLLGLEPLTARDRTAPGLDSIVDEFGLSEPRKDCPLEMDRYSGFPYSNGDLSQTYVAPPTKALRSFEAMPKYMQDMARIYRPAENEGALPCCDPPPS